MDWTSLLKDVGFPIALAVYLLVTHRRERESLVKDLQSSHSETILAHRTAKDDLKAVIEEANASRREDAVSKTKLADAVTGMEFAISRIAKLGGARGKAPGGLRSWASWRSSLP